MCISSVDGVSSMQNKLPGVHVQRKVPLDAKSENGIPAVRFVTLVGLIAGTNHINQLWCELGQQLFT